MHGHGHEQFKSILKALRVLVKIACYLIWYNVPRLKANEAMRSISAVLFQQNRFQITLLNPTHLWLFACFLYLMDENWLIFYSNDARDFAAAHIK